MLPPDAALTVLVKLTVNVFDVGTVRIWKTLSSKSELDLPVPVGKVTLSNNTMSPISKPWSADV